MRSTQYVQHYNVPGMNYALYTLSFVFIFVTLPEGTQKETERILSPLCFRTSCG